MQYFFEGTLTEGSFLITDIDSVKFNQFLKKNSIGQYLYADHGIDVSTQIESIDVNAGTLIMNKPALLDGNFVFEITSDGVGVWHEKNCAYTDVYNECHERGKDVLFKIRTEQQIERDKYGGRKTQISSHDFLTKAYPINYSPSNKDLIQAGIKEPCECVLYIPTKYFNDLAINYHEIDIIRTSIIIDDESFEIRDKARHSQFADVFLYYTFGVTRKP